MGIIPLEEAVKQVPPCHSKACAIQNCIQKNGYNEAKCQDQIDALYACCELFYKQQGRDARTVSCPKPNLLDLKIKQRKEEKEKGGNGPLYHEPKIR
ncbi:Cx9C motif-containing protein 4, mitochondrial [Orbilia javanica]|uniref:Cx9C motif-containing protein 4, mitochondrial n=1 Tax=Orbilia javanica TaxID=47235 RepID=A0AAN8MST7_9PEZI